VSRNGQPVMRLILTLALAHLRRCLGLPVTKDSADVGRTSFKMVLGQRLEAMLDARTRHGRCVEGEICETLVSAILRNAGREGSDGWERCETCGGPG
jgi:hypothetical protein